MLLTTVIVYEQINEKRTIIVVNNPHTNGGEKNKEDMFVKQYNKSSKGREVQ